MSNFSNHTPPSSIAQDKLYSQPREAITDFVFDESVVKVFEDMIGRSVPGYRTLLSMLPVLARYFVTPESSCYDLGCSLGASTLAMQQGIDKPGVNIVAVDNSSAMLEKCEALVSKHQSQVKIDLKLADINDIKIDNASLVVMNFTLQFVEESLRQSLIKNIYEGLHAGGALMLSEKIKAGTEPEDERLISLHHAFKKANGYSELEISQKRAALEKVLVPETLDKHKQRLQQAGFKEVIVWFQCFNFVSLLAIK